jgi:hypothetical protein
MESWSGVWPRLLRHMQMLAAEIEKGTRQTLTGAASVP